MDLHVELKVTGRLTPTASQYDRSSIVAAGTDLSLTDLADNEAAGSTLTPAQVDQITERVDAALKDISKRIHAELDRLTEAAESRALDARKVERADALVDSPF